MKARRSSDYCLVRFLSGVHYLYGGAWGKPDDTTRDWTDKGPPAIGRLAFYTLLLTHPMDLFRLGTWLVALLFTKPMLEEQRKYRFLQKFLPAAQRIQLSRGSDGESLLRGDLIRWTPPPFQKSCIRPCIGAYKVTIITTRLALYYTQGRLLVWWGTWPDEWPDLTWRMTWPDLTNDLTWPDEWLDLKIGYIHPLSRSCSLSA